METLFPKIGLGLGLRTPHYHDILHGEVQIDWFEAVSENYMGIAEGNGGNPIHILEKIRAKTPIALHGVSLNIGSTDDLNFNYLKKLKQLVERIEPVWVSDHFCWTGVNGENLHDLLPLPYTAETVDHVVSRILRCQDFLGQRLVFENVSSYVQFTHSEMSEWEFISEISKRADCGILLDVNNIYVSAVNHGFNPLDFLSGIPIERVAQMHLAGHSDCGTHLIDTHDHPVCDDVWNLYRDALKRFSAVSTMVEWDANIPRFELLQNEIFKAKIIQDDFIEHKQKHKFERYPQSAQISA